MRRRRPRRSSSAATVTASAGSRGCRGRDRVVDILVGRSVEVAQGEGVQHVGDGVLAKQHAAQHRLFGGQILWWLAGKSSARTSLSRRWTEGRSLTRAMVGFTF